MPKGIRKLYSPEGELIWEEGRSGGPEAILGEIDAHPGHSALVKLLESPRETNRGKILASAEKLSFVTRCGNPKGFLTLLPRGWMLEACTHAFNRVHLQALGATRIDFPHVFELDRHDDMYSLTTSYEQQGAMYHLASPDEGLCLSYAADPGLFSWLRGRCLDPGRLPYAIHSLTPVFRRIKSGKVGGLDHLREYVVPDLHVLCRPGQTLDAYLDCVAQSAAGCRFWFGEAFAHFLQTVPEMLGRFPKLLSRAARAARQYTLVTILPERPRYYGVKNGLVVDGGFDLVMLYNLQLDDTNGARFGIRSAGTPVEILHATVAGGWPKLLPLILGRGLDRLGPRAVPLEMALEQVTVLPVAERHVSLARDFAEKLGRNGIRAGLETQFQQRLGSRIQRLRQDWQPAYCVCGDREMDQDPLIEWVDKSCEPMTCHELVATFRDRLDRCRPESVPARADLPF